MTREAALRILKKERQITIDYPEILYDMEEDKRKEHEAYDEALDVAIEVLEQLKEIEMKKMTKYTVVRTYAQNSIAQATKLKEAFDNGWEFVRASEFIPGNRDVAGYIEYILKKEEDVTITKEVMK